MPATATPETPDVIEDDLSDLKARRDRLKEKREEIEADLEKAHDRLREADSEEEQDDVLDDSHELQVRRDTLQEAEDDVRGDIAELEQRLDEAKAARREEERLEELAEMGREAVEARRDYESIRDELVEVMEGKAPELAHRFSAWLDAAEAFRDALKRENGNVYYRPSSTTAEEEARVEELVEEMKSRGVADFKSAMAPHYRSGEARRWVGWDHESGYDALDGGLRGAIETVRAVGENQS